jgi:hypothetical protein
MHHFDDQHAFPDDSEPLGITTRDRVLAWAIAILIAAALVILKCAIFALIAVVRN